MKSNENLAQVNFGKLADARKKQERERRSRSSSRLNGSVLRAMEHVTEREEAKITFINRPYYSDNSTAANTKYAVNNKYKPDRKYQKPLNNTAYEFSQLRSRLLTKSQKIDEDLASFKESLGEKRESKGVFSERVRY